MHTMTKVRWMALSLGTSALVAALLVADDTTARFVAGYAYGMGLVVLAFSEWIIARTRNHPQVRAANIRQGSLER